MCELCHSKLNRRHLAGLFGVAAVVGALPGLTHRAKAATAGAVEALVVTCMDYRIVDETCHYFDNRGMTNKYDLVAMAGATLAATSNKLPNSNASFWDHVGFAKQLHHVTKVILVDHFDCGAYRLAAGAPTTMKRDVEIAMHKAEMVKLKAELSKRHPDLGSEFLMMNLDGKVDTIAI